VLVASGYSSGSIAGPGISDSNAWAKECSIST